MPTIAQTINLIHQIEAGIHISTHITVSQVTDLNIPSDSYRNAHSFNCSEAESVDYDITNGATSPRNSAYKWGSEAINFFRRAGNSNVRFNVRILHFFICV